VSDVAPPNPIIVAGALYVDPSERDSYLQACHDVIVAARKADGCIDFHLTADPLEADRINVYEQWESVSAVESFRGSGPSPEQTAAIRDARVAQYEVASSTHL
jgi:quinol monooxygenase YgiN